MSSKREIITAYAEQYGAGKAPVIRATVIINGHRTTWELDRPEREILPYKVAKALARKIDAVGEIDLRRWEEVIDPPRNPWRL